MLTATGSDSKSDLLSPQLFEKMRIVELTLLDQTFDVQADFDVQKYLAAEQQMEPRVQVRMRFAPEAALQALDNRASWETVDEQPDGSVIVTFAVTDLEWAAWTALGYGPQAVVLEPEELRRRVSERACAIVALYASTAATP